MARGEGEGRTAVTELAAERRAAAGAVVVRSDGRLLVIRRGRAPGVGEWTLAGGKVEPGETPAETVVREVREETGLRVRVVTELGVVPLDRDGHSYAIAEHLCVPDDDAPLRPGDDAAEARWVTESELVGLGVSDAARAVVAQGLAALGALELGSLFRDEPT